MHSSLVRAQTVFGFFTSVAFALAAIIALSDFSHPRTPRAKVSLDSVQVVKGRSSYYSSKKEEFAHIRFSLDADFSSLFNWNTKQVFVYVTASWPGATDGETNEAVIWDQIITAPSADRLTNLPPVAKKKLIRSGEGKSIDPSRGILRLKNQKHKYQITAPSGKIANTENVTLKVHYNVQPWVGALTWSPGWDIGKWKRIFGGVSDAFTLPQVKVKN